MSQADIDFHKINFARQQGGNRSVAALFDKIGYGILVTHSHSGGMGWDTVIKSPNIRAVVSYEPGSNFFFRKAKSLRQCRASSGMESIGLPMADFMKLTRVPIVIYYGNNIPEQTSKDLGKDQMSCFC